MPSRHVQISHVSSRKRAKPRGEDKDADRLRGRARDISGPTLMARPQAFPISRARAISMRPLKDRPLWGLDDSWGEPTYLNETAHGKVRGPPIIRTDVRYHAGLRTHSLPSCARAPARLRHRDRRERN